MKSNLTEYAKSIGWLDAKRGNNFVGTYRGDEKESYELGQNLYKEGKPYPFT